MSTPRLVLSPDQRRQLTAAAQASRPEECCGILVGSHGHGETRIERVRPASNLSSADRRRHYEIDSRAVVEARKEAAVAGLEVVGFYHSHPQGGDRPSGRDRSEAWPEFSYLIVSPHGGLTSWRLAADGEMVEELLVEASP